MLMRPMLLIRAMLLIKAKAKLSAMEIADLKVAMFLL
jgi:hypothetical protein